MSIASNFPALKPTLLLDFANTEELDPRITFTRASTATYYGTQTAKAEENLLLQSQTFDNAIWSKTATTVTANSTAAPDGTTTADTFTATATTNTHATSQTLTIPIGSITVSFFAKADTHRYIQIYSAVQAMYANFDVLAGAGATGSSGGVISSSITDAGNGWYRCILTFSNATATAIGFALISSLTAARAESWTTAGTEAVFLWGAQLEQRSAVTAYTATTTQPITNYIPQLLTAASGVARFDHNPTTFESLGLEIEEQRANLLTYSEQFDNAAWTKSNASITANTVVAPDGTLTGDKLVEDTANSQHYAVQLTIPKPSANPTISVYAKAAGRNWIYLNVFPSTPNDFVNDTRAYFDLSTGTVGTVTRGTATIVSVGNGWYRCSLTASQFSSTASANCSSVIHAASANGTASYTGDGFSGLFIWGAQLEAGGFATSYIPTVASQVTRAADAASMTGTNFSSWYNQAEGTLFSQASCQGIGASNASIAFSVFDGASNVIRTGWHGGLAGTQPTSTQSGITTNGTSQAAISGGYISGFNTSAFAYKRNDLAASANGGAAVTDTDAILPNVISASIGNWTGTQPINGTIKKIAYYPIRVTNAQLVALTS